MEYLDVQLNVSVMSIIIMDFRTLDNTYIYDSLNSPISEPTHQLENGIVPVLVVSLPGGDRSFAVPVYEWQVKYKRVVLSFSLFFTYLAATLSTGYLLFQWPATTTTTAP